VLAASIITAAATVALAVLAYFQIRAGRHQAEAAKAQSDAALKITREQAAAAVAIAKETREAAERQWQPRVIANPWPGPSRGDGDNAAPDEMAVSYYLGNDGSGPAFNVEHGIEVAGKLLAWEGGLYRTMRAGQEFPPSWSATSERSCSARSPRRAPRSWPRISSSASVGSSSVRDDGPQQSRGLPGR